LIDDDQDASPIDRRRTLDAEMNLGLGLRHKSATFTATR